MMDKEIDIKEMQARLLSMVKQFHSFCENEKVVYYILAGTCLGAYRHKGFIPWDDDIDVGLPRSQYEVLINEKAKNLPDNLEIITHRSSKGYPYNFAKLIDKNTTLIEADYQNFVGGLYIDIFPLDGVCNNSFFDKIRRKRLYYLHGSAMYNCSTAEKKSLLKRLFMAYTKKKDLNKIQNKVDVIMEKYSFEESEIIANYLGSWKEKEVMEKRLFGTPKLYEFEDTMLYGPELMPEYLEKMYGDFMKLPPEEERVHRHGIHYLDLNNSYLEYCQR